jgi:aminoglycoside phosphotransferase (APT) family kinase protein
VSNPPPKSARAETVLPDDTLKAVVSAHMPGARFKRAFPLSGGVSANVYRLEIEAEDGAASSVVLRVHGPHHNGHPAALEFDVLRAVTDLGICAPRALALDESLRHIPYPFLVLQHIDGETAFPTSATDPRIGGMAEALARIHDAPIAGLPGLPLRDDPVPELPDFLPHGEEFEPLRLWLSTIGHARHDGPAALLHGDFWPGNLLWQGERLTGILDWEDAACGDPLSDVACTALELRYVAGRDGAESFVRAYDARRPVEPRRLALWQVYVAAAGHSSMGAWGLAADREAHMRATALSVIREASALAM